MKNQNLLDNLTGFLEANIQLVKLEVKEMLSKAIVTTVTLVVTVCLLVTALFFANIALAFYLNESMAFEKTSSGFGLVALIHLSILLLFLIFRGLFRRKVEKTIDKKLPLNIPTKHLKS